MPVLADLKPSGKYVMAELVEIGGLTPLMKRLLDAGLLHGDCADRDRQDAGREPGATCTTIPPARTSCAASTTPIKKDSHLVVLYGNLAPDGAVAKISGKEGERFSGQGARLRPRRGALDGDPRRPDQGRAT